VLEIRQTDIFRDWINSLKDRRAARKIAMRIDRAAYGNFGDVKSVGEGVSEMRIHYGPGYRVYFVQRGNTLVVLLSGGSKRTQAKDIKKAKELAKL